MSTLLLFTILVCVVAAIVLVLHLIERVREIEKHARQVALEAGANRTTDLRFGELAGEDLWQALTGERADDIDPEVVDAMRQDYEPVLQRHIDELDAAVGHQRDIGAGTPTGQAGQLGIGLDHADLSNMRGVKSIH